MEHVIKLMGDLVAGILGSLVGLNLHEKKSMSKWQVFLMIVSGTLCSVYLTPLVLNYFDWGMEYQNGASFLVGMLGLSVAKKLSFTITSFKK